MRERAARVVDARGKHCPVPILELARALREVPLGAAVLLLGTDPAIEADLRAFCEATGHRLLELAHEGGAHRGLVEKAR